MGVSELHKEDIKNMENTFSDVEKARLPTPDEKVAITSIAAGTTTAVTAAQKVYLDQLVAGTYKIVLAAERTTLTGTKTILDSLIGTPTAAVVSVAEHTTLTGTKTILDSLIGTPTAAVVSVAEHTTLTSCKTILDSLIGTPTAAVVSVAEHTTLTNAKSILDSLTGTPTTAVITVAEHTTLTNTKSILDSLIGTPTAAVVPVANATTLANAKSILDSLTGTPTTSVVTVAEKAALSRIAAMPLYCYLGAPALASGALLVSAHGWSDGVISALTTLDVPRTITALLTDGDNSCAGTLTIVGVDNQGRNVSEVLTVTAAPGGKTLTGTKIFNTITSITLSSCSGGGGGDVLNIGSGTVIGLPFDITAAGSVKVTYFNAVAITPTIATGVSTSGLDGSASTYNGIKVLFSLVQAA